MEKEKNYRAKNILTVVFGCLLFVFIAVGMSLNSGVDDIGTHLLSFITIIFFGGGLIYYLIKLFTDKNFWEKQKKEQMKIKPSSYLYQVKHPFEQDINVFKILKKNFFFAIPYILSLICIISFFKLDFDLSVLSVVEKLNLGSWRIPVHFYLLSFICFSFFILGYLALGEILQRHFQRAKNNFILDMVINYIYAIPFIAILSLAWVIFPFIGDDNNNSLPSSFSNALRTFSLYALFVMLKYYVYINLAIIAFEDMHKSIPFKESFQYLKIERKKLFFIWFNSGLIFGIPLFIGAGLVMWNFKFHFINEDIPFFITFISFILIFIWGLLSEQISFLLYFIKSRHKECNIENLK